MQNFSPRNHFSVTFTNHKNIAIGLSLLDAVNRFAEADLVWISVLETAAAGLSERARHAFGLALCLLEPGRAPFESPFVLVPDDRDAINAEADHMLLIQLSCIGTTVPAILTPGHPEIAKVEGLITAVHRILRLAKTHA
jgi:hypothetical protein